MLGITDGRGTFVTWEIHFGPTTNNEYALCREGGFCYGAFETKAAVSVPVFGPGMLVVVTNHGHTTRMWTEKGILFANSRGIPAVRGSCGPPRPRAGCLPRRGPNG